MSTTKFSKFDDILCAALGKRVYSFSVALHVLIDMYKELMTKCML